MNRTNGEGSNGGNGRTRPAPAQERNQPSTLPQRSTPRRGNAVRRGEKNNVLMVHPPVLRLHVQLEEIEPPVWRLIEVPADITLRRLHDILQLVMGWHDCHLHCFVIDGVRYGFGDNEYDEDEREDDRVLLRDVVHHSGDEFRYEYDYGDDWQHRIVVEQIRRDVPPGAVPRLLAGSRACPPEDCGGVHGYYELLEVLEDPHHEEHAMTLRWVGGNYDPDEYDVGACDRALALLRARRAVERQPGDRRRRKAQSAGPVLSPGAHVAGLLDVLANVREALPEIPPQTFATARKLLLRHARRAPEVFLSVRKQGIWLAAALHAACMVQPRWRLLPLPRLTIEEVAAIFDVSPASVSGRSAELRRG